MNARIEDGLREIDWYRREKGEFKWGEKSIANSVGANRPSGFEGDSNFTVSENILVEGSWPLKIDLWVRIKR